MTTMQMAARVVLWGLEAVLALPLLYLLLLSVAALWGARRRPAGSEGDAGEALTFALLVPAHDEAQGIEATLASLAAVRYPPQRRTIYVVADNCTDATAALARAAGAHVYERTDRAHATKGHALRYLLECLERDGLHADAYVIVDADSRLAPDFLSAMARALHAGASVAQAQYRVLNARQGGTAGLRAIAIALFNHVRPLGRRTLGWSAGLKGNGMCFTREALQRFGWGAHSLAEDAEQHAQLLAAGVRVAYVPEAVVAAEMPISLAQARSQQARWERGRLELIRGCVPLLLRAAVARRDLAPLDAAAELLVPPLSLLLAGVAVGSVGALALGEPGPLVGALLLALALLAHLASGIALGRLPFTVWLSLLALPAFAAWKCWIYLAALFGHGPGAWQRTRRVHTALPPSARAR